MIHMNKVLQKSFFIVPLLVFVVLFSGCSKKKQEKTLENQPYGGVLRSEDMGKSFSPRSIVEVEGKANKTLASTNVLSIAIDPKDDNIMYVGTESSGIFRTEDAGKKWKRLDFSPKYTPVIAVDPINTNIIYASAIFEGRGRLFKSEDSGQKWREVYVEPRSNTHVSALAISPYDSNVIFLGTSSAKGHSTLSKSLNGGETWIDLYDATSTFSNISFDAKDSEIVYAYNSKKDIIRTNDGGKTWQILADISKKEKKIMEKKIYADCRKSFKDSRDIRECKEREIEKRGIHFYDGVVFSFLSHPRAAGVLYVGTNKGLYRSRDYGVDWDEVDIISSSKGLPIRGLAASPEGYGMLYVAGKSVYVRPDKENEWAITDTKSNRDVVVATYSPKDPNVIYLGLKIIKKKKKGMFSF